MSRPKGQTNITLVVDVVESYCPMCGSTERTHYDGRRNRTIETPGVRADGTKYNRIVRRPTKCKQCGTRRIDRTFE